MTGRKDSAQLLEDLYRRNLYVVAADEAETSFRYHDLFADFLRERLRRERPSDWVTLHERAAQAETSPHHRLLHLLTAESWDAAAAAIEAIGPDYVQRGFAVTLHRWISALPEGVRQRNPRVLYLLGHAIWTQRDFSQAQPYLEQALEGFRRNKDHAGQGEALAALSNSALMNLRFDESRELLREALSFDLPEASRLHIHAVSSWDAIYRQDWTEFEEHLEELYRLVGKGAGDSNPLAMMVLLFSTGIRGRIKRLEQLCSQMEQRLGAESGDLAWGCYHLLKTGVYANRGDVARTLASSEESMAYCRRCGKHALIEAALCTSFSLVACAKGDWADLEFWATEGLDEMKYGQIPRNWRLHSLYFQARARCHSGNLEALRETYNNALTPNPFEAPAAAAYRHMIRGMLRMAERSYAQAEQAFREALRAEEKYRVTRAISSARVMLAHVLLTRGQAAEAMEVFLPYLQECWEEGTAGFLMRDNPIVIPLLRHAHERGICAAFAAQVLERMGVAIDAMEAAGSEALSEREMEVLRVLSDGLGNREIAEKLFVSEATVKTHVQRIMRKLDATSRTQAVARARELMLL
ncbi:MAG: LuxR C-terminal-related transcriptional regulator [Acidobacteriota bacterium]